MLICDVLKEPDALVLVDWLCAIESLSDSDVLVELESLTLVEPDIESLKLVDVETDTLPLIESDVESEVLVEFDLLMLRRITCRH